MESKQKTIRQLLIRQLRHALHLVECPNEMVIEFDIMETTYEFDLLQTAPKSTWEEK